MRSRIDQMATEFTFLCQSYINQYIFFPNEHAEKAGKFISAMKHFQGPKLTTKHLITLILLLQGLEDYLVQNESEKFLSKVRGFLHNYHLNSDSKGTLADFVKTTHGDCAVEHITPWVEDNDNAKAYVLHKNTKDLDNDHNDFLIKISEEILKVVKTKGYVTTAAYYKDESPLQLWLKETDPKRQQFINMHYRLWNRDRSSFGGCLRNTKVDYSQSLDFFVKHARNNNNRSREAFMILDLMDKNGRLTNLGEEELTNVELSSVI